MNIYYPIFFFKSIVFFFILYYSLSFFYFIFLTVNVEEDVLFIHGFISSSAFWIETLFPCFSKSTKSKHRLFAFDLLGFGRSPKPSHSLYTIREHLEMIESSIIEPYKVKSFHVVAHSLGCILALALALKHPGSIKSITLVAPVSILFHIASCYKK